MLSNLWPYISFHVSGEELSITLNLCPHSHQLTAHRSLRVLWGMPPKKKMLSDAELVQRSVVPVIRSSSFRGWSRYLRMHDLTPWPRCFAHLTGTETQEKPCIAPTFSYPFREEDGLSYALHRSLGPFVPRFCNTSESQEQRTRGRRSHSAERDALCNINSTKPAQLTTAKYTHSLSSACVYWIHHSILSPPTSPYPLYPTPLKFHRLNLGCPFPALSTALHKIVLPSPIAAILFHHSAAMSASPTCGGRTL